MPILADRVRWCKLQRTLFLRRTVMKRNGIKFIFVKDLYRSYLEIKWLERWRNLVLWRQLLKISRLRLVLIPLKSWLRNFWIRRVTMDFYSELLQIIKTIFHSWRHRTNRWINKEVNWEHKRMHLVLTSASIQIWPKRRKSYILLMKNQLLVSFMLRN